MFIEQFTDKVRESIIHTRQSCLISNLKYISPENLILTLLQKDFFEVSSLLNELHINVDKLIKKMSDSDNYVYNEKVRNNDDNRDISFHDKAKALLEVAVDEAKKLNFQQANTINLFVAALKLAPEIFPNYFIEEYSEMIMINIYFLDSPELSRSRGMDIVESESVKRTPLKPKNIKTEFLDKYSVDYTIRAQESKFPPFLGREKEISKVIQTLCKKMKRNVIILGEPGVGKTALVEGLAKRIVVHNVPADLYYSRVVSLNLNSVVAGTKWRGQFEERLENIIQDVVKAKNIILFIDEIHMLCGTGSGDQGSTFDAMQILKPVLSRGDIQVIGATTFKEYHKYLEKDGAFTRRFQIVKVKPFTSEYTRKILNIVNHQYSIYHGVNISENILDSIVFLSEKYLPYRNFPDKAIDLLDEVCSRVKVRRDKLSHKALRMLTYLKIATCRFQYYEAIGNEGLFEKVKTKFNMMWDKYEDLTNFSRFSSSAILEAQTSDVVHIIQEWTGISVSSVCSENKELIKLSNNIKSRLIGQDYAVDTVSDTIVRSRVGLINKDKPIGSFLFIGNSGVGKTELSKLLAEQLFASRDRVIRIDMSEYMEKHNISRLIGSPPGYVGYNEGGQLTEKVYQNPYSIVLLDEIEKAHPSVLNCFLQVLEEGCLTDGSGKRVDFTNTVIIMTSNVGTSVVNNFKSLGFRNNITSNKSLFEEELKNSFSSEFINRINEVVIFNDLIKDDLRSIASLNLDNLNDKLSELNLKLVWDGVVIDWLVDNDYDVSFGARYILRNIEKFVERFLAKILLEREDKDELEVRIYCEDNILKLSKFEFCMG